MAFSDPGTGRDILDSGRGTEPEKVTLAEDCQCGDANTIIGVAISATKVLFFLNGRPDSTA